MPRLSLAAANSPQSQRIPAIASAVRKRTVDPGRRAVGIGSAAVPGRTSTTMRGSRSARAASHRFGPNAASSACASTSGSGGGAAGAAPAARDDSRKARMVAMRWRHVTAPQVHVGALPGGGRRTSAPSSQRPRMVAPSAERIGARPSARSRLARFTRPRLVAAARTSGPIARRSGRSGSVIRAAPFLGNSRVPPASCSRRSRQPRRAASPWRGRRRGSLRHRGRRGRRSGPLAGQAR